MSLDSRSTAILTQLLNANSYLSIQELTERINVSRRTIYYDIEKINHWLSEQGLSNIQHVRSAGFFLDEETKREIPNKLESLQAWHYEYSAVERKAWLAIYLLTSHSALYLENLMEKVRVSRNTTIEDLKVLKEELLRNNLELKFDKKTGYIISGVESDKRKAIVYYLSIAVPEQSWQSLLAEIQVLLNSYKGTGPDAKESAAQLFNIEELKAIYSVVAQSEQELNIRFTDDVLHSLSLRILLFAKRLLQGKRINMDPVEKEVLRDTKEYQAALNITQELENIYGIPFPEDETYYITTHLLGAKVQYVEHELVDSQYTQELRSIVTRMVNDFQRYACVLFQNRQALEKNLLLHLKPTYYRLKYGLIVENHMADLIKAKYHEVFLLTTKVMHHLESFVGLSVHENEIAFIAVHFGGWMRREGIEPATRKKALIICANGVGTSQILRHQLEGLFSTVDIVGTVSLREFEHYEYDVDFVISTTPVTKKKHPTFVVNPILTEAEKESLLKKVNVLFSSSLPQSKSIDGLMSIIQRHASIHDEGTLYKELREYLNHPTTAFLQKVKPSLQELIHKDMVQLVSGVNSWQDAIELTAMPLLQQGYITQEYIKAMIANVNKLGPYIVIAPKVAIPHAKPENGVLELGMSLLRLEQPIAFSTKKEHAVQVLIALAPIDNEMHLKALSQLSVMMSDSRNIDSLIAAQSNEELLQLVQQSIH